MKNALLIQNKLQETNRNFFFLHSMHLDLLHNCQQVIPTLAEWLYKEWHIYDASLTKKKLIQSFKARLNDDKIPITFVALKDTQPIGLISLKGQTDLEFSDFPKESVWMGSFYVIPEEKNQGIGEELLNFAVAVTRSLGHKKMYFYTSNPSNLKWYLKRGALIIEERSFRNHMITILHIPL